MTRLITLHGVLQESSLNDILHNKDLNEARKPVTTTIPNL